MAKTQIKNYVFTPGISAIGNLFPNAYSLLSSNKSFIQKEATAWIAAQVLANASGFVGYTYNQAKCERDVGYVIDAYLNDLRYGGNEKLKNTIKYYWDQGVAQVDGDREPEIQTHTFIGTLITDYILTNTLYTALNTEVTQTVDITKTSETNSYTPTGAKYTPTTGEMTLTITGHNLTVGSSIVIAPNGLTFTCELDGNATLHPYPRASGVPNTTGRDPFYNTALTVSAVTTNTVTVNVGISSDTSKHTFVSATTGAVSSSANVIIDTFVYATVNVITDGLTQSPTLVPSGVSKIKFQGNYSIDEILLITNSTRSEVMYNFTNVSTGGSAEVITNGVTEDLDFPKFLQTTDGITIVKLNYDTRTHSSTDDIQLYVEQLDNGKSTVTTRPYAFGTDAIERNRVATPTSMLDADFEYGLQPTKWAAIATMRGYPSVYEIPGTDTPVTSVVTDASAGTSGIGQSLITVTTTGAHGFVAGTPITIKALEDSVVGAARAEGSFVIVTVPTNNTFTYYAKAKVGTINPTTISTTYTQLRQAGFYTGATVGKPSFTIASQGSSGTITAQLAVSTGSTIIPFDGPAPEIGSPLSNVNIPLGSQVVGIIDTSAGGGTYVTPAIVDTVEIGSNRVYLESTSGIVNNLAADRGDGRATYINNVEPTYVEFTQPFTSELVPNKKTYVGVSGENVTPAGINATFDITLTNDGARSYTVVINNAGSGYQVGDRITIDGISVGGQSVINNLTITVSTVGVSGNITAVTRTGVHWDGTLSLTNVSGSYTGGLGTGATFDLAYTAGAYTSVTVASSSTDADYKVGDVILILGSSISGIDGANDLYITVTGIDGSGGITTLSYSGTPPIASQTYSSVGTVIPYVYSGVTGEFAVFNVSRTAGAYAVDIVNPGRDYLPTETFTVLGANLGGTTPANNLTITIDNVGGTGDITSITATGTASTSGTKSSIAGTNRIGTGATFDVSISGSSYVVAINNAGTGYGANQVLVIPGGLLSGTTPTNNLNITITSVNAISTGVITAISRSGTVATPGGTYTGISGSNQTPLGDAATFNVSKDFASYDSVIVANAGTGYKIGDSITLAGTSFDGVTPGNNINLRVTSVAFDGGIEDLTYIYTAAEYGTNFDLISTVLMTEATTNLISKNTAITYSALATAEATFVNAHGLVPGSTFITSITSDDGTNNHNLVSGSYIATDIPTTKKLRFQVRAPGSINIVTGAIAGNIYPRPDSFFIHRPFDGGVQLGTGGPQHGAQAIRQSKKYIRYQSGKGIMYTTGALFAPSYDLRSLTAEDIEVGSLITVETDDNDHGVQVGGIVRILGVDTPGYNSGSQTAVPPQFDYRVEDVIDERTFKIRAQRRLGSTNAVLGFGAQMSVVSWHGATVRSGIFDDQNGIFWEYDGTNISVNQRTGTQQLAGTISLAVDDNLVTGVNTRFNDQLKAGDRIIIKGMTHVVSHVDSQTSCTVTPDWRGIVNITGAKANLIVDKKVKQREFNLDRLDGTGPSGYDIDIAKMQMIGIQYSWYGAGFIDFMLRGSDGNFVFAHRMRNSNVNTEAFMRSGNLPVRYEVTNEGPSGKLAEAMTDSQNYLVLENASFFPESGTIYIDNEIITFSGKNDSTNRLTGLTRGATFTNFQAGSDRNYTAGPAETHSAKTGVVLISQTITPLISHWGSAFLTDGGFDEDRGYIFSYAETQVSVSTTKQTAFMIRLAPSVSNALTGDLGQRELLNRAQLLLQGLEITSDTGTGGIVVDGVLNPQNYPLNPADVGWSGLSGVAQGGQPSFAQIASGGSVVWSSGAAATTSTATASPNFSAVLNSGLYNTGNNSQYVFISANDYRATFGSADVNLVIGRPITGTGIQANTTITSAYISPTSGDNYGYFYLSRNTNAFRSANTADAYTVAFNTTLVNRNFAYLTIASFDASGAKVGTKMKDGGGLVFPANTLVNNVSIRSWAGNSYYEVQLNNSYTGTLTANTGTLTFEFVQPPYAQPGETVFSFIATPGERSTLDLTQLKELTNTPLGGRGTYPNGPDVLAINVYKVTGTDIKANIIVRWGEAQA